MKRAPFAWLLLLALTLNAAGASSRRQIQFTVGANTLTGLLELPPRAEPHPVIIFATDDGPVPKETFISPSPTNAAERAHHAIGDWQRFLRLGFGCFAWDKPGTGDSAGQWLPDTATARSEEVVAAIATLKQIPGIDTKRIGLWCNAQAAQALGGVLAGAPDLAFVIAISPPVQTPLESAASQLRGELTGRGIEPARVDRAANLLLRKWEMLRSGIPFTALTKYIATERPILGDADHPWLAPFTPDEFAALTGPRRAELEAWFDSPFTRLLHLDKPALAFFGADNPGVTDRPEQHPHLNVLRLRDADHRLLRPDDSAPPSYWRALETFFAARFPEADRRSPLASKSTTLDLDPLAVTLNFLDARAIAHELNLTDLTRRALQHYLAVFGGPPRDERGNPAQALTLNIDHGKLTARTMPARIDLTIGPQQALGYRDWRTTFLHELARLWIGRSFAPRSPLEEWFNEGATEYVALKTALRLGVIPAANGPELLTRSWGNYLSARGIGEISLREAGRAGRQAHYFLLLHGGLTATMVLDYEIRRHTANQQGLPELLRLLHNGRQYDADMLVRHLRNLTNEDFAPFFRRHIAGAQIIPVGQHITRMEVEAIKTGQLDRLPPLDRQILEAVFEIAPQP